MTDTHENIFMIFCSLSGIFARTFGLKKYKVNGVSVLLLLSGESSNSQMLLGKTSFSTFVLKAKEIFNARKMTIENSNLI